MSGELILFLYTAAWLAAVSPVVWIEAHDPLPSPGAGEGGNTLSALLANRDGNAIDYPWGVAG